jgi:hypothetical protein
MELSERIEGLSRWGKEIKNISQAELDTIFEKARSKNAWFTQESCSYSLSETAKWLTTGSLTTWIESYNINSIPLPKSIGLVMAGNIPLVGFHDLLSVLIAGHSAKIKLSSQDNELLPFLVQRLFDLDSRWNTYLSYAERLKDIEGVIATGSDNSARYFEYYFKSIPKIIRKNRTSVAILSGKEDVDEVKLLGQDIFSYYGLGCRNVSKIYIPEAFDLSLFNTAFKQYENIPNHNKYGNN